VSLELLSNMGLEVSSSKLLIASLFWGFGATNLPLVKFQVCVGFTGETVIVFRRTALLGIDVFFLFEVTTPFFVFELFYFEEFSDE
jgi:hypothetical protein